MSFCKSCKIFKNPYIVKHPAMVASIYCQTNINLKESLLVPNLLFSFDLSEIWKQKKLLIHLQIQMKFVMILTTF